MLPKDLPALRDITMKETNKINIVNLITLSLAGFSKSTRIDLGYVAV